MLICSGRGGPTRLGKRFGACLFALTLLALSLSLARFIYAQTEPRDDLVARFLANPVIAERFRDHRVEVIRLVLGRPDMKDAAELGDRAIATLVVFDHTALEASRFIIDATTAEPLREERLPGQPQSSPDEVARATAIISADPDHARFFEAGSVLDGGFIVQPPQGADVRGRLIQFLLLTADRLTLQRVITVDLTHDVIFSSINPPATPIP